MSERGTGRTTAQMLLAPQEAVFVWPSTNLTYPSALAEHLRRRDLMIVPPRWIDNMGTWLRGRRQTVLLDHGIDVTAWPLLRQKTWELYENAT